MSLNETLQALHDTPLAAAISGSAVIFPWIESFHVLAITFVVGSIAMVDLRLLGLVGRREDVSRMLQDIVPWTVSAFGVAAVTGSLLFASNAVRYWNNGFFRAKLILLALAGLNMLVFHFGIGKRAAEWGNAAAIPQAARLSGALSLAFWVVIVIFGRWVGFTL